jgi:hypothetical protein
MLQSQRLSLLSKHVDQHGMFEVLLELLKDENPIQYKRFEPYYEETE